MTNGPGARIAEIVANTMPRNERHRNDLHRHPQYLCHPQPSVEFLVNRSKAFRTRRSPSKATTPPTGLVKPVCAASIAG